MKTLIDIVINSLRTRSEEQATDGHGEVSLNAQQRQDAALGGVQYALKSFQERNASSITPNPSLSQCEASKDGTIIVHDCALVHPAGKSCALLATQSRQEKRMPGEKKRGTKNDKGKPPLALIPPEAIRQMGAAFGGRDSNIDQWNYRYGIEVTRTLSGAMRHIMDALEGIDVDPKSGATSLGSAMANIGMAIDTIKNHPEFDDRFKGDK